MGTCQSPSGMESLQGPLSYGSQHRVFSTTHKLSLPRLLLWACFNDSITNSQNFGFHLSCLGHPSLGNFHSLRQAALFSKPQRTKQFSSLLLTLSPSTQTICSMNQYFTPSKQMNMWIRYSPDFPLILWKTFFP